MPGPDISALGRTSSFSVPKSFVQTMNTVDKLQRIDVVTAFLRHQGKILVVRRSTRVGSYQGCWSGISGYLEDSPPLAQALREIREETGLREDQVELVSPGASLEVPAPELRTLWVVHPLLFELSDPGMIQLDWENTEARWVNPDEMDNLDTVPCLSEALKSCDPAHSRTS